jgi:putative hydrolase of the HAD superfamily
MRFNAILLDLDNTIYHYKPAHSIALDTMIEQVVTCTGIKREKIQECYKQARMRNHIELDGTAASHNRLLYVQRLYEFLGVNSLEYSLETYESYWSAFLSNMEPFYGVFEFLEKYSDRKFAFVTDLTAHIQFRKIKKLGLAKYVDFLVTSEEAGHEKPHPYGFLKALEKLNMSVDEVCYIGDNYKKDILGSLNIGIKPFWITDDDPTVVDSDVVKCKNFSELLEIFHERNY